VVKRTPKLACIFVVHFFATLNVGCPLAPLLSFHCGKALKIGS